MPSKDQHILGQHRAHRESDVRREESGATIQLRQEELAARTRAVDAGRVSVGTEVVQEQQTLEVPVTREEVSMERHAVDRRPSDTPISATSDTLTVPVHEEHAEPHASAAWVAPDGSFYPCHWLEHDRLAYRLAGAYYNSPDGPRTLERCGWVRLQHDGSVVWHTRGQLLSQAQLDVLFTLLQTSEGSYRANIGEVLELSLMAERLRLGRRPSNG